MMLAYSAALTLALLVSAPWWLFRMATTERYREGLRERLGRVPAQLRSFLANPNPCAPHLDSEMWATTAAETSRTLWLHAVSVGEVLAATRLVAELEIAFPSHRIVISTTTRTGQALARERFCADRVFYFPLDFAFAVRAYLDALQPAALILMESELWPRLLHECATRNIPIAVVNARVSDRSFARSMRFRGLWRRMARHVTLWLAQSNEDARRLTTLLSSTTSQPVILSGARSAQSKDPEEPRATTSSSTFSPQRLAPDVRVTGNLKYDIRAPKQSRITELIREAANGRPIIVAGSTVASAEQKVECEEAQVLFAWMHGAQPLNALLVLAPRHPERFEEVWRIAYDFPALRATDLLAGKKHNNAVARTHPDGKSLETADIILLDTIGDLAAVYGVAAIAYVGGSMFPRGGHNPLEPAQFGVPVVMGESYENFREIVRRMIDVSGIRIVKDESDLDLAFEYLLKNPESARAMGERGRQVFEQQQGATARMVEALVAMLQAEAR